MPSTMLDDRGTKLDENQFFIPNHLFSYQLLIAFSVSVTELGSCNTVVIAGMVYSPTKIIYFGGGNSKPSPAGTHPLNSG